MDSSGSSEDVMAIRLFRCGGAVGGAAAAASRAGEKEKVPRVSACVRLLFSFGLLASGAVSVVRLVGRCLRCVSVTTDQGVGKERERVSD